MVTPQKQSQNETLKGLQAQALAMLDALVAGPANPQAHLIQILHLIAELIEVMQEPEDPG